tara:strand:+ start:49 stop:642 length:594 start_codon:yes stop_codon:yes gene_type:complete
MFIISFILNLITISIVGLFALIVYMSYRKRPDLKSTPLQVMRDIVGGQAGHARVYKIAPFKRNLTGPVGEFGNYSDPDAEYSDLSGNSYNHIIGRKPWDGVGNANFGSRVGVEDEPDDFYSRSEQIRDLEDGRGGFYPSEIQKSLLDTMDPSDTRFDEKIEMIKTISENDPNYQFIVQDIKSQLTPQQAAYRQANSS